jgi:hypothetical protein
MVGMQQLVERGGLDAVTASSCVIRPSAASSTAMRKRGLGRALAVAGLQHPELARSMVNSMSCMSR